MVDQHISDELCQVLKSEPPDNSDEQTNTTVGAITMLPEVKPDLETTISEAERDRADRNTRMYSQQQNEALKCEVSDLYSLHEQTNTTTEDITKYHKDEPDAQTFICDHCNRQFTVKSSLEQHIISDHNSAGSNIVIVECISLSCTKCDYKGNSTKQLERHALLHDEKRRFVCSTCGYRFVNKYKLQSHIKVHAKDHKNLRRKTRTTFKCNHCNYESARKFYLTIHLRIHTGDKPFECDCCDFKCVRKDILINHSRIHTGDKPFKCDHCDYRSARKGDVTRHIKLHTGYKPYACDYCDYKSVHLKCIVVHTRVHTGDKPFKCDHCDSKFAQKITLKRHIVSRHPGKTEKTFQCTFCQYTTEYNYHLQRHVQSVH